MNAFSGGYLNSVYWPEEHALQETAQRPTDKKPKI
jgi:hypothetical protein